MEQVDLWFTEIILTVYSTIKLSKFWGSYPIWFFVVLSDDVQLLDTIDS